MGRYQKQLAILLTILIVLIAYGQTLQMYFINDDYTHLYHVQQNQASPYPYQAYTFLIKLVYPLIGLNPTGYFLIGIFLYVVATVLVYLLAVSIFEKRMLAFLVSLIFATGYVGEDSLRMFLGDGFPILVGLILQLTALIAFIKYLRQRNSLWLVITLIAFVITLEIAPHRFFGLLLMIWAIDWLFFATHRQALSQLLLRNALFGSVAVIQYLVHPSYLVFNYPMPDESPFLGSSGLFKNFRSNPVGLVGNLRLEYFANTLGTFWNLIFPYDLSRHLYLSIKAPVIRENLTRFFLLIPLGWTIITLWLVKLLRPQLPTKKIVVTLTVIILLAIFWASLVDLLAVSTLHQISMVNGGALVLMLIALILLGIPYSMFNTWLSLALILTSLSIFLVVKPGVELESSHRYLLPSAAVTPFLLSIFITKELLDKKKKIIAWVLLLTPVLLWSILHLGAAIVTHRDYYLRVSVPTKQIYADLKRLIPNINDRTIIYTEGSTREFDYQLGNAFRVGMLKSEASLAVFYQTQIDNILLLEKLDDLPQKYQTDKVAKEQVYSFIYDGHLKDTSDNLREILTTPSSIALQIDQLINQTPAVILQAEQSIPSQLPLLVEIDLQAMPDPNQILGEVEISWRYSSEGPVYASRSIKLTIPVDGGIYRRVFTIPAGGETLKELSVKGKSFPGSVTIGKIKMTNVN